MNIVQVATEFSPLMYVGNLADALSGLCRYLTESGDRVCLFIPGYRLLFEEHKLQNIEKIQEHYIEMGPDFERVEIQRAEFETNLTVYLVCRDEYFDRQGAYGNFERPYDDNARRFICFSKAVVETLPRIDFHPEIIHCHDWTTGLVPLFLRYTEGTRQLSLADRTVFTIHNISNQGLFPGKKFTLTNLPDELFRPEGVEFFGQLNLLKAGVVSADHITTVSPSYAEEILTSEEGYGMEGTLRERRDMLTGIRHAIDTEANDPATDEGLPANYSADDLRGKNSCREALLAQVGIDTSFDGPVFVSTNIFYDPLSRQFMQVFKDFLEFQKVLFLLVVRNPRDVSATSCKELEAAYPNKVRLLLSPSKSRLRKIFAGSDFWLSPRKDQPVGFNPLVSHRYGVLPVASRLGGMQDVVTDIEAAPDEATGILFAPEQSSLTDALQKAMALYKDKEMLAALRKRAMSKDLSWREPGQQYRGVYRNLLMS